MQWVALGVVVLAALFFALTAAARLLGKPGLAPWVRIGPLMPRLASTARLDSGRGGGMTPVRLVYSTATCVLAATVFSGRMARIRRRAVAVAAPVDGPRHSQMRLATRPGHHRGRAKAR